MSEPSLLQRIIDLLDAAGVPHMITGSLASTFHGSPRSTQDIDIVIDPSVQGLDALLREVDPTRYYLSPEAARDALHSRGQFNLIDLATGWKIDLILRKDRPFSREEFARRRPARLGVRMSS